MSDTELNKIKLDITDLSEAKRKARNLLRRSYCFEGKNIIIAIPFYQNDGANEGARTNTDKLRNLVNLKDAFYLRDRLYRKKEGSKLVEVITSEKDICSLKGKLKRIDCLILSHEFIEPDKCELICELKEHFDCKNMIIIELK